MGGRTYILTLVVALLLAASEGIAQEQHEKKGGRSLVSAEKSHERITAFLKRSIEQGSPDATFKIESSSDPFVQSELFKQPAGDTKTIVISRSQAKDLRDQVSRIWQYAKDLKRLCIDGKIDNQSSVFFFRYLEEFLADLSSGAPDENDPARVLAINKARIGEFLGGLREYIQQKDDRFITHIATFYSLDNQLLRAATRMTEILQASDAENDTATFEVPLKNALAALRRIDGPPCVPGTVVPSKAPPSVDYTKLSFHEDEGGKEILKPKFDAGAKFEISLPVKDEHSGISSSGANFFFRGPGGKQLYFSGSYDRGKGAMIFKVALDRYLPSGTYQLTSLRNLYNRAGIQREDDAPFERSISFEVVNSDPDTTPPTVDFAKAKFLVTSPLKTGERPKILVGKHIEFTIPVRDDKSGLINNTSGTARFFNGKGHEISVSGAYDEKTGLMKFRLEVGQSQSPGFYRLESVYGIYDMAGNSGSSSPPMDFSFEVDNPDPDTIPPVIHYEKALIDGVPLKKGEIPKVQASGGFQVAIPVSDDKAGIENGGSGYARFIGPDGEFYQNLTYDRSTGRIQGKVEVGKYARSGIYTLAAISGLRDRAGNRLEDSHVPTVPVRVEVINPNADSVAPTVEIAKAKFDTSSTKAGGRVVLSVPVHDSNSGVDPNATAYAYFRGPDEKQISFTGRYDVESGAVRFLIDVNPFAAPGRYSLHYVSSVRDNAGNNVPEARLETPISFEVTNPNPDTTAPRPVFTKTEFHLNPPGKGDEPPKQQAGKTFEISIPFSDDNSGIENKAQGQIHFSGPMGKTLYGQGRYDKASGRVTFKVEVSPWAVPGKYQISSVSRIEDRAGNSKDETPNSPVSIEITNDNPDSTPPVADLSKAKLITQPEVKAGEVPRVSAGGNLVFSVPVRDENSGVPHGAQATVYFTLPDRTYITGYGAYDEDSGSIRIVIRIPQGANPGVYTFESVSFSDRAGNEVNRQQVTPAPLQFTVAP